LSKLLLVERLTKHFPVEKGLFGASQAVVHAVDDLSFEIDERETFSIVGETGSGKTTVAKTIMRFIEPTSGRICFQGRDLLPLSKEEMRCTRSRLQMIFQDPFASLNPRMTVEDIVGLPLEAFGLAEGRDRTDRVCEILELVGLRPAEKLLDRYPHEFSGGQRQRIGVARALVVNPRLVVADEPVSSLDVSVRAQILNLLQDLKQRLSLTYLLIAHDLAVVKFMSDWVLVMYLGRAVELARSRELYHNPVHPYTQALLSAVLVPDPSRTLQRIKLTGEMPSPINPPAGCRFHTRCPVMKEKCRMETPDLQKCAPDHWAACHST